MNDSFIQKENTRARFAPIIIYLFTVFAHLFSSTLYAIALWNGIKTTNIAKTVINIFILEFVYVFKIFEFECWFILMRRWKTKMTEFDNNNLHIYQKSLLSLSVNTCELYAVLFVIMIHCLYLDLDWFNISYQSSKNEIWIYFWCRWLKLFFFYFFLFFQHITWCAHLLNIRHLIWIFARVKVA